VADTLLVCLNPGWGGPEAVESALTLAATLGMELAALYVVTMRRRRRPFARWRWERALRRARAAAGPLGVGVREVTVTAHSVPDGLFLAAETLGAMVALPVAEGRRIVRLEAVSLPVAARR
jgi:K+-sensing histidine kinase KdpD